MAPHHEAVYESYHVTHPELDHKYDDQHDIEPVHFHEHAVLPAVLHPDRHSYDDSVKVGFKLGVDVDSQGQNDAKDQKNYYAPAHYDFDHHAIKPRDYYDDSVKVGFKLGVAVDGKNEA